ncbi:FkbM family methyltransferase [Streptomyces samsunensis]|uniref:FkbM family methyltransferase n=1 Tax=Streptomyces TaxID=1883 RepID=UPI00081DE1D7|nr:MULTISPECIES: FkbM family methyltransferase [Streptomyces]MYU16797.1 FkbM family methyltransferase [Streptomyces sp. SID8361]NUH41306.1 FkbM family methyltransferase [Streptomyces samsunensis]SCG11369.1 methyltransferase, FkbM family [Streptomyces sp. MnatMP-M27]
MTDLESVQVADGFSVSVPQLKDALFSEIHFIYHEVFVERDYLKHGIRLSDSARIVDIGANVGMFSLFVMQECPGARILAFEPIPAIHQALLENLDSHGAKDVQVVRAALGRRPEERVRFTYYPGLPGNSTRYPEQKKLNKELIAEQMGHEAVDRIMGGVEVEAEVRRLSDELRDWAPEGPIDLLKIDVEGAELEVMEGLDASDWQRVRQCVIEVQDLDGRLDAVLGVLDAQGFTVTTESAVNIPEVLRASMVYATRERAQ